MSLLSRFAQAYDPTVTTGDELFTETNGVENATDAALFLIPVLIVLAITYVIYSWLTARIFAKAGIPTWKAWVPVYNIWLTFKLGNQGGWWAILMFIPVVNLVAGIIFYIAQYRIGLKLNKPGAFVLLAIFIPILWYAWLGFDDSVWNETEPSVAPATPPAAA